MTARSGFDSHTLPPFFLSDAMTNHRVRTGWLIGMAVLFALAHTQSLHVWSNQNQYYLHGAAIARAGDLKNDWLANTRDPTLVFSSLVALAYSWPGSPALSIVYVAMLMSYFLTIDRLLNALFGVERPGRCVVMAIFLFCHSAVIRVASAWLLGKDYPWYLQAGVAGQYLLGPGLQPSVFGVFLLIGMANFAEDRPYRAAAWAVMAAVFHSTYFLTAALLLLGFQTELLARGRYRTAIGSGLTALAIAAPILVYVVTMFAGTEAGALAQSQYLLVNIRLPHHCRVDRWLDGVAIAQLIGIACGWWLLRRTDLFRTIGMVIGVATVLTVAQWATGNRSLALMFPWRVSAALMPIALALLIDRLYAKVRIGGCRNASIHPAGWFVALAIGLVAAGSGIWITSARVGYYVNREEDGIMEFVAQNRQPGDVYLLPMRIPDLTVGQRGSASLTFIKSAQDDQRIPPDFQQFRLTTGAAIYVDFKSIPYADTEVLEWYRRMQACEHWYARNDWDDVADELRIADVTHIVVLAVAPVKGRRLRRVYCDDRYALYRVEPAIRAIP
jgi:hypothetical protein